MEPDSSKTKNGSFVPPNDVVAAVKQLVEEDAELAVARKLGISLSALSRLCGGLPCRAGTIELVRSRLGLAS